MKRAGFQRFVHNLDKGPDPSPRDAPLLVAGLVREGLCYRLPSGHVVMVVGVNHTNVSCVYWPDGGSHEMVAMTRIFFASQAVLLSACPSNLSDLVFVTPS